MVWGKLVSIMNSRYDDIQHSKLSYKDLTNRTPAKVSQYLVYPLPGCGQNIYSHYKTNTDTIIKERWWITYYVDSSF